MSLECEGCNKNTKKVGTYEEMFCYGEATSQSGTEIVEIKD